MENSVPFSYGATVLTIALSLILNSATAFAKNEPWSESPSVKDGVATPLPPAMKDLAAEKSRQESAAPGWLKTFIHKKVRTYFTKSADRKAIKQAESLKRLLDDAVKVAAAFEEDDQSEEFKQFAEQNLKPFIESLNAQKILSPIRGDVILEPIGEWSVQTLVVKRMLTFLARHKDFHNRALNLVSGKHLKGATSAAAFLVLGAVAYYFFPNVSFSTGAFVLGTLWFSLKAGPFASILSAGSGWFVRPTTEQLHVLESRYTGHWEVHLNAMFDKLQVKSTAPQTDLDKNDHVRIANLEEDGMNFGGMNEEDQRANWDQALNMFVVVAKRFGQLLRGTHHAGRDLMMLSWSDEQNVSQLVETMDSKRIILRAEALAVLTPHLSAFLVRGENHRKVEMEELFERFESLCESVWLEPDQNTETIARLIDEVSAVRTQLTTLGLSEHDFRRLIAIQKERGRAVGTMVTALATGEVRGFFSAERNRNLAPRARILQRTIRRGLGTQNHVDDYETLIRRKHHMMGMRNSGDPLQAPTDENVAADHCLVSQLRSIFMTQEKPPHQQSECEGALQIKTSTVRAEDATAINAAVEKCAARDLK